MKIMDMCQKHVNIQYINGIKLWSDLNGWNNNNNSNVDLINNRVINCLPLNI